MKLKHAVLALVTVRMLSTQAQATEAQLVATLPTSSVSVFTRAYMVALFDNAHQPIQLAMLTEQGMKETEGRLFGYFIWNA